MSDDVFTRTASRVSDEIGNDNDSNQEDAVELSLEDAAQLEYLGGFDKNFKDSQEYKDLLALNKDKSNQADDEEEDESEQDDDSDEFEDETEEEEEDESDIFGITKAKKGGKEIKVDFDVPKEMVSLISDKFGIKDPNKFFNSVATWRNQAQQGETIRKEHANLMSDIHAMPPDMKNAITLWANGEDYTKPFVANQRLNFSDGFEKQDTEGLVQHYHPEQYKKLVKDLNDEKLTDEQFDDKIELLAASTEKLFVNDKKALEKEREEYATRSENEYKLLKKSASLSVDKLSKAFPNFRSNELNKVRSILIEGRIDDLFYNEDGSYNEDAAEKIAFALYGDKIKGLIEKVSKRKGETEANIKQVDKSPKTIRKQKSTHQGKDRTDMSQINHLAPMFKSDPYA